MAIEDDDKPRKKITHEIGQDLSLLSVEELTERIALMNSEIERLQAGRHEEARVEGCGEQFFQVVDDRLAQDAMSAARRAATNSGRAASRELHSGQDCSGRSHHVVPANAGSIRRGASLAGRWPTFAAITSPVAMGPASQDDQRLKSIQKLGHWPTWQIIPEENRSFTKD